MGKSKEPPRLVQKATGWNYTRSLRFVRGNGALAASYAAVEGVSRSAAYVALAKAEAEADAEQQQEGLD